MSALAVADGRDQPRPGLPRHRRPRAEVAEAAVAAIRAGHNQYPPGIGIPELRRRSPSINAASTASTFDPDTEVLVTAGATEAIAAAAARAVRARRRGGRPSSRTTTRTRRAPRWPARVRPVVTLPPARLPRSTSTRCGPRSRRAPSCSCSTRRTTRRARSSTRRRAATSSREVCVEHDLIVVTDEVYEHLVFDGEHVPLATLPGHAATARSRSRRRARRSRSPAGRSAGCARPPSW